MKKIILILSFIILPLQSHAFLGDVSRPFCEDVQKLGPILNSFTTVQWPVTGVPGITMGLAQNTSVIMDLCNLVMQIEQLSTEDAIFATAGALNELTDRRFDESFRLADQTWNLANTVYDFENGTSRRGAFESVGTYREMDNFMRNSYSYYHKTFNGKDARLKNRFEREQDMERYGRLAWKRAILAEATNCPVPQTNDNFKNIFEKESAPHYQTREDEQVSVDFYQGQLLKMAPRFSNNQNEMEEFTRGLENVITSAVNYQIRVVNDNQTTYKANGLDANGNPQGDSVSLERKVQVFTVRLFPDIFQEFQDRWDSQWRSWVNSQFVGTGIRGLLIGKKERILRDFIDLSWECNPDRLMRGYDSSRADYFRVQQERIAICRKSAVVNKEKSESLFTFYIRNLRTSLRNLKEANAKIWSAESKYLGINRTVDVANAADNFQQEQVTCEENLRPAEMQKLSLKQQQVENEYNEVITKQLMKQTTMLEMKEKNDFERREEERRRKEFAENTQERTKNDLSNTIAPAIIEGGY